MRCPGREFWAKVDQKLPFWGKNREVGKNRKIFKQNEKRLYYHVCIFKIHVLANFYEEILIFDEIRGHLVILQFYRAWTRDSEGLLRKRAILFEVEVLDTPNFHRTCVI